MSEGLSQFFGGAVCCGTCRFFVRASYTGAPDETGFCRRFPPTPLPANWGTVFPGVGTQWWCGEYQPPAQEPSK